MDSFEKLNDKISIYFPSTLEEHENYCIDLLKKGYLNIALGYLYYLVVKAKKSGILQFRLNSLKMISKTTFDLGHHKECEEYLTRGMDLSSDLPQRDMAIYFTILNAYLRLNMNQLDDADNLITNADLMLKSWHNADFSVDLKIIKSRLNSLSGYSEAAVGYAKKALQEIPLTKDPLFSVKAYEALAVAYIEHGDSNEALRYYNVAIENCNISGNGYHMAKLYLDVGKFVGKELNSLGSILQKDFSRPPAWYFAKSLHLFSKYGTVHDLEKVNFGFRKFGRRESDRFVNRSIIEKANTISYHNSKLAKAATEYLRKMSQLCFEYIGDEDVKNISSNEDVKNISSNEDVKNISSIESNIQNSLKTFMFTHSSLIKVEDAHRTLVEAANNLGVERSKLANMITVSRELILIREEEKLFGTLVNMVFEVTGADGVCFLPNSPESIIRGSIIRGVPDDNWHSIAESVLDSDKSILPLFNDRTHEKEENTSATSNQSVAAIPIKCGDACYGIIYLDKKQSRGKLSKIDCNMLEALVLNGGTLLDNFRMSRIMKTTTSNIEATLDAISDGVITLNRKKIVVSLNRAALNMLNESRNSILGKYITDIPGSWPNDRNLFKGSKGEMFVKLPRGEVMVNLRPLYDEFGKESGEVLTLTELKRVKNAVRTIAVSTPRYTFENLMGKSEAFVEQVAMARMAGEVNSDILILGESGTGKEVFAQAIHNASSRSSGPFVGINCAAIPGELLESELFGYAEGAFTGALKGGKIGKFELAEGGTILLDEIGDMPLEMQAKLLRVLQERSFRRVGGTDEYIFDVRVFSTTNRPLEELVKKNQFRIDLLYRLKVLQIKIPPLRDRYGDVSLLIKFFLKKYSQKIGKDIERFSSSVMKYMVEYQWPGNIRELEHVIEAEISLAPKGKSVISSIPLAIKNSDNEVQNSIEPDCTALLGKSLKEMEKIVFYDTLINCKGSASAAAKELGLSRGTVYNKIKQFNLDLDEIRWEAKKR
jgi:transcriptional regulator with PAS, ATPase and Fis domain/tetratricopeptide (TPR) repeat protein